MAAPKGNDFAKIWNDPKKNKLNLTMDQLIDDLLTFCETSKSIHLSPWCRKHGFSKSWIEMTAEHYPELLEAIGHAKEILASKIVNSSFRDKENEVNATVGMAYLGVYDMDYRAFLKFKADISKEQVKEAQNQCAFNDWKEQQKTTKESET